MTMALQKGVVYGPLRSRRFGSSLGINLLPASRKLCTFRCGYCQYAESPPGARADWPTLESVERETRGALERLKRAKKPVDWIVFCGNGEPTLYPDFPEAVSIVRSLRDDFFPRAPLGILSNSSLCGRPRVREGLRMLDGRFLKLDAGGAAVFRRVNVPQDPGRSFVRLVDDLRRLSVEMTVTLQSLFLTGAVDNSTDGAVREWISAIDTINPIAVHVYTIDRAPQNRALRPVGRRRLREIAARAERATGISCSVY